MANLAGRWLYRSRQFFGALVGGVEAKDTAEARRVLGEELYPMFAAMPTQYRRHAFTVYRRVRDGGCGDPHVLQAALLHDAGKYDPNSGRYVTIAHRVAIVLLKAVPPGRSLLLRFGRYKKPHGLVGYLLYPFYLSKHHAESAAERASQYGTHPRVVSLIRDHHKYRHIDPGLAALQGADEAS